ncbi:branched-chain amino acid transport system ATP-binding protein [Desulfonatronum thiosulfatophilum]|uniref:Branched-chain amino acid transport system ATP-binding protein n=1 Tax=Desulfonatronum thiosulfatophilum TaxID=617002 RepID=A0A1G6EHQ7_9BACT|nr:ABC transporter ATP-binding protein [Desulfonatronum thiosulfatophilum]SDB56951.1 branched-chain amino acid transport system ATP-binding protein [Desulfonatronum thiosulfatophilum]
MLVLKNVDVFYGRVHAVRRVSLHVNQGEIVALIGGNGAGKTTLLTTISGLLRARGGSLGFEGRDITRERPERIVSAGISQVPERRLVFKPMTVADNLLLGAYHRYSLKNKTLISKDVDQIYEMFPVLGQRRDQPAGNLSGGEQQMLAIGRALMAKPRMLLLDEPGMGLAPALSQMIFRHVAELRDVFGLTVLLVEQNAKSALKIADRGYVLETGRIILQGPSEELLLNRDVQRAYLGRDVGDES